MQDRNQSNSSRAEMIRQARENINRNQNMQGHSNSDKKSLNNSYDSEEDTYYDRMYKIKMLMIRSVIAVLLFLAVVAMDQMSITYHNIKSSTIKDAIGTNQTMENVQETVTSFTEEKIIPVFHRLW
jgi:hypothetical protein